jgi:deoxyxylulose-5-phosphate synthase
MLFAFFLQRCSGSPAGDDGRTNQGGSNISDSCSILHILVAAPRDEDELQHLLSTATKAGCPMIARRISSSFAELANGGDNRQ